MVCSRQTFKYLGSVLIIMFKHKYCLESEKSLEANKDKKVISIDTYATLESLEELMFYVRRLKHG